MFNTNQVRKEKFIINHFIYQNNIDISLCLYCLILSNFQLSVPYLFSTLLWVIF